MQDLLTAATQIKKKQADPTVQVLLVDDQPANLLALEAVLNDLGPTLVKARSGEDALRCLLREEFAVVLLDVQMQGMDGFETARLIRGREKSRHTPIIFITAFESNRLPVEEAYALGAVDYLLKPVVPVILRAKVAQFIDLFEKTEQVRRQAEQLRQLERQQAEQLLRDSQARHTAILEAALDGIVTIDHQGKILEFNPAAEAMFGYDRAAVVGQSMADLLIPPGLRDLHNQGLAHFLATGEGPVLNRRIEVTTQRADGSTFPVELAITRIGAGGPPLFTAHVRDITERRRADQTRARLAAIVESSEDAIVGKTLDGIIDSWNPGAERLYGYTAEEVLGQPVDLLIPPDRADEYRQLVDRLRAGVPIRQIETVRRHKDGRLLDVALSISPIKDQQGRIVGTSASARDITQTKRLEEHCRQAQKMESVGRLAGGVAHDFNNLLTVISGYSEFLVAALEPGDVLHQHAEEIKAAADRAASLTRQLLAFSRKQILSPQVLDVNALIARMEQMLRRLLGGAVELTTVLAPRLGRIKADPGQIEQVLMNLTVNARDAMPRGGRLTIETSALEVTEASPTADLPPGPYILLQVTDTGCGMDAGVQAHLFEPFFTTKEVGQGTGLGLATIYGIVKQSGGQVEAVSALGRGTTFRVFLPRVASPVEASQLAASPAAPGRGTETILLVEDDDIVRALNRTIFRQQGFTVLEASHGEEALAVCAQYADPIHLLVTDVMMPRMNGRQVADHLLAQRPHLKVLYVSGHTEDALVHQGVLEEATAFLQKPFTLAALLGQVRALLDS